MDKSDSKLIRLEDIWTAFGLLTRLPMPDRVWNVARPAARAAWAYPLVGAGVGGLAGLIGAAALWLGTPTGFAAALVLVSLSLLTGAMHEDGLADSADGFWGGNDPARRLEIMHDSHIGAYGVIALIAGFALRWSALTALIAVGGIWMPILVVAIASRAAMVGVMHALPHARASGLSQLTGRAGRAATLLAALTAALACLAGFGVSGLWLIIIAAITPLACAILAHRKIGGQTGDILGATQQLTEIALLGAICAIAL